MEKEIQDLITIREAGKIAGVSHVSIWNWIQAGKLNGIRIGKSLFVRRSEVKAYADERAKKATK